VLCDLQELSYADAATALDCAVGTVAIAAAPREGAPDRENAGRERVRRSMIKGCLA
jgi:DNA-directed RNA polymerase specialized sigma24 family protein